MPDPAQLAANASDIAPQSAHDLSLIQPDTSTAPPFMLADFLGNFFSNNSSSQQKNYLQQIIREHKSNPKDLFEKLVDCIQTVALTDEVVQRNLNLIRAIASIQIESEILLLKFIHRVSLYSEALSQEFDSSENQRHLRPILKTFLHALPPHLLSYHFGDISPKYERDQDTYSNKFNEFTRQRQSYSPLGEAILGTLTKVGELVSATKLLHANLRIIRNVVNEFTNTNVPIIDQIAVGLEALQGTILTWNPHQDVSLTAIATLAVREALNDYITQERSGYPEPVLLSSRDFRATSLLKILSLQQADYDFIYIRPYCPEMPVSADGKLNIKLPLSNERFVDLKEFVGQRVVISSGEDKGYTHCLVIKSKDKNNSAVVVVGESRIDGNLAYRPLFKRLNFLNASNPGAFLRSNRPERDVLIPAWRDVLVNEIPQRITNSIELSRSLSILSELSQIRTKSEMQSQLVLQKMRNIAKDVAQLDLLRGNMLALFHRAFTSIFNTTIAKDINVDSIDYPTNATFNVGVSSYRTRFYPCFAFIQAENKYLFGCFPIQDPNLLDNKDLALSLEIQKTRKGLNYHAELELTGREENSTIHRYLLVAGKHIEIRSKEQMFFDFLHNEETHIPAQFFNPAARYEYVVTCLAKHSEDSKVLIDALTAVFPDKFSSAQDITFCCYILNALAAQQDMTDFTLLQPLMLKIVQLLKQIKKLENKEELLIDGKLLKACHGIIDKIPNEFLFYQNKNYELPKNKQERTSYVRELNAKPRLTDFGEKALCALVQCGDKNAAFQFIEGSLWLLPTVACTFLKKIAGRNQYAINDLISWGYKGLTQAVNGYYALADKNFYTYANQAVFHTIAAGARTQKEVVDLRSAHQILSEIRSVLEKLSYKSGDIPEKSEEILAELKDQYPGRWTHSRLLNYSQYLHKVDVSIDATHSDDDERTLTDRLPQYDEKLEAIRNGAIKFSEAIEELLSAAIAVHKRLHPVTKPEAREKAFNFFRAYYLSASQNPSGKQPSMEELGAKVGITGKAARDSLSVQIKTVIKCLRIAAKENDFTVNDIQL